MNHKPEKITRLQLSLPESSYERLMALKNKTGASSYADVLKNALRLYEDVIAQHETGNRLFIEDATGSLTEYKVFN